ncbi:MAG: hypothetical protein QOE86_1246 [Solirubrobacteraceae bacterium]|nr:hypothetical protein [Solirubrobacteraceae bacterium]
MPRPATIPAAAVLAVTGLALGACGGASRSDAVNVATTWLKAVQQGDDTAACKLMDAKAAEVIASKYVRDREQASCGEIVAGYRDGVGTDTLKRVLDGGLEASGTVRKGYIGVFPKQAPFQHDIVLMHSLGGHWAVASTGIE